jgi:hypothetical protein
MYQEPTAEPSREQPRRRAIRLIFEYEGDEVRLVSRQRVEMYVPPSDDVKGYEERGLWGEVRRADGAALYRRALSDPMPRTVEVFSNDPEQTIVRVPIERPSGTFVVVVPDLDEADHLALTSSGAPEHAQLRGAAVEILRVPLGRQDEGGAS